MKLSFARFQIALVGSLAALASAAVALNGVALTPSFYFEVKMSSSTAGTGQIFYNIGRGISEHDSVRLPVGSGESSAVYRFPLPEADYRALRFDPLNHGNSNIVISYARIVDAHTHERTGRQRTPDRYPDPRTRRYLDRAGRLKTLPAQLKP